MAANSFLDFFPLWLINLIVTGTVLLIIELGWQLGRYRRSHHIEEEKAPVNAAVGATLNLLAFLLAFTFSIAASRFDIRKQIVLQEANAIGTTYLRADYLEENMREEVRTALREYTVLRAGGAAAITTAEGMQKPGSFRTV
jgi:cation transport ATPase